MDPVTLAIVMGLTSAVTNPEVAGAMGKGLFNAFDKDAKAYRKHMRDLRERLKKDDFGLSEVQKNTIMSSATRQQQAAARGTADEIRRQGAAMGGRTAASAEALRGVTSDLAGQAAAARGGLEAESAKLGSAQRDAARTMIDARRKEKQAAAEAAGRTIAESVGSFEEGMKASLAGSKSPANAKGPAGALGITGQANKQAAGNWTSGAASAEEERLRLQREYEERMRSAGGAQDWSNSYSR